MFSRSDGYGESQLAIREHNFTLFLNVHMTCVCMALPTRTALSALLSYFSVGPNYEQKFVRFFVKESWNNRRIPVELLTSSLVVSLDWLGNGKWKADWIGLFGVSWEKSF